VLSEPALLEASLAISLRHRSGVLARQTSNWYAYRAVRMVNERLGEPREKLTDGLIAAVFTLSYSEVRTFPLDVFITLFLMPYSSCRRMRWLVTFTSTA
jgi:hypothetical protein